MEDLPRSISDVELGIKHRVYEDGTFSCIHELTAKMQKSLAEQLKNSHEELVEALGEFQADRCNLMEVLRTKQQSFGKDSKSCGGTAGLSCWFSE